LVFYQVGAICDPHLGQWPKADRAKGGAKGFLQIALIRQTVMSIYLSASLLFLILASHASPVSARLRGNEWLAATPANKNNKLA